MCLIRHCCTHDYDICILMLFYKVKKLFCGSKISVFKSEMGRQLFCYGAGKQCDFTSQLIGCICHRNTHFAGTWVGEKANRVHELTSWASGNKDFPAGERFHLEVFSGKIGSAHVCTPVMWPFRRR